MYGHGLFRYTLLKHISSCFSSTKYRPITPVMLTFSTNARNKSGMPLLTFGRQLLHPRSWQMQARAVSRDSNKIVMNHISQSQPCIGHGLNFQHVRFMSFRDYMKTENKFASYFVRSSFVIGFALFCAFLYASYSIGDRQKRGFTDVFMGSLSRPRLYRYKEFVIPSMFEPIMTDLEGFQVREDDIFLVSFPRSGLLLLCHLNLL